MLIFSVYFLFGIYIQIEDAVQPADIAMKNLLYSMLSVEGSYKSHKVCSHVTNMFDLTSIAM